MGAEKYFREVFNVRLFRENIIVTDRRVRSVSRQMNNDFNSSNNQSDKDSLKIDTKGKKSASLLSGFFRFQLCFWSFFFFVYWALASDFWGGMLVALRLGSALLLCYLIFTYGVRFIFIKLRIKGVFVFRTLMTVLFVSLVGALIMSFIAMTFLAVSGDIDRVGEGGDRVLPRIVFHGMVLITWSLVYLGGVAEVTTRLGSGRLCWLQNVRSYRC